MPSLLEQLQALPDAWGLVAVDGNKRAYQRNWQENPLSKDQAAAEITAGRAKAIGVLAGPISGGLLFVDHDGRTASDELERLCCPTRKLPSSVAWTSGRDGRFQVAYHVPPEYWPHLRGRRVFKTGHLDSEGKAENLDLRWAGHYSVVIGSHPQTSGYRWFRGTSPADKAIATAPLALIELLLSNPTPSTSATPLLQPLVTPPPPPPTADPLPFLDFISRDSRDLVETGGTPGSWNDDHLALSLDLLGTEAWILAQGQRPDMTARDAFAAHISRAKALAPDFDERKAWVRFDGAAAHNPTPSTPIDLLLQRLGFHTRLSRPLLPPKQQEAGGAPQQPPALDAAPTATTTNPKPPRKQQQTQQAGTVSAPSFPKPQRLEARELLHMLRAQAVGGRLAFNEFLQQVELDGEPVPAIDRYYLKVAELGDYKVTKDLATDCLIEVATENTYNPVCNYLNQVADTITPALLDRLATAYLRPEDCQSAPTLYDHMLRCTLIGAVRRAFDPGSKHDTACVLVGDQAARKSSFWAILGGPFFSDSLGDLSTKDDLLKLHQSWLMEWAELDHITSRRHAGHIKSFLSQATDLFRVPYGRETKRHPRRGIIVGTTNDACGLLSDPTGNRRFWIIPTTRTASQPIDTAALAHERDAIWAAAVHAFRNGEANYLPHDLAQQVDAENEAYLVQNPWAAPIAQWLAQPANVGRSVTTEQVLSEAIERPVERQTRNDQIQVGAILRDLGYVRRRSTSGSRGWFYELPPPG